MAVIINNFEEYEGIYKRIINGIEMDEEVVKGTGIYVYGTSLEQPLGFNDEFKSIGNILYVNETYYDQHREQIDKLIEDTLKNTVKSRIRLDSASLINDRFLNAIAKNKKIKEVKLDPTKNLNKSQIDILVTSDIEKIICSVDFEDDFDFLYEHVPKLTISNYPKIGKMSIDNFASNNVYLKIDEPLSNEQLTQLQKLFEKYPQENVTIEFNDKTQIKEVISTVNSKEIVIADKKEYTEDDYALFSSLPRNISIELKPGRTVQPTNSKKREIILNGIIEEVKTHELSPLEKYMYLYNVVKLFKEYKGEKENEENKSISRHSAFTLFNEYMVCAGYTELLCELVDRLNEPNLKVCEYTCTVWSEKKQEEVKHTKCLVKIKDEKYGVEGVYISDPTWDHVTYHKKYLNDEGKIETDYTVSWANRDLYNHFLLTKEEVVDAKIKYACPDETDILFMGASTFSEEEIEYLPHLVSFAQDAMQKLNPHKEMSIDELNAEISNISQPSIGVDKIIAAISSLYSKIFYGSEEQINNLVQQTIEFNNEVQRKNFDKTRDKFNITSNKTY